MAVVVVLEVEAQLGSLGELCACSNPATRTQLHQFFRSLPPDRFPALVTLGEHVWVDNRNERFTAGLDVLIAGLEHAHNSPSDPS